MIAKLTTKNQITLPKAVVSKFPGAPVATSNSPICGQVKFPQGRRQERLDCYADCVPFARRLAASLSR